jgi:hypothetical protein
MLLCSTSFVRVSLTPGWTLGFIRAYLKWYLATVPPYVVVFASNSLALLPFAWGEHAMRMRCGSLSLGILATWPNHRRARSAM